MSGETIVDPGWRERVLRRMRLGDWRESRYLIAEVVSDYVEGQPDVPKTLSKHDCDCEYCTVAGEEEIEWDDPRVVAWQQEGEEWAKRAIRELEYLGVLRMDGASVILTGKEVSIDAPHIAASRGKGE